MGKGVGEYQGTQIHSLGPVKVRERRAWQGFAMLIVAQERPTTGGAAEMSGVAFSSVQTRCTSAAELTLPRHE